MERGESTEDTTEANRKRANLRRVIGGIEHTAIMEYGRARARNMALPQLIELVSPLRAPRRAESRVRLPVNLRCDFCGILMTMGTVLDSSQDLAGGRYYLKCSGCPVRVSVKRDLENSEYVVEFGATIEARSAEDEACGIELDQGNAHSFYGFKADLVPEDNETGARR